MQEINISTMAFLWHTIMGQKQNAEWAGLAVLVGTSNFWTGTKKIGTWKMTRHNNQSCLICAR